MGLFRADRLASFKIAQDRAFGAIIAVALVGKFLDRIPYGGHCGHLRRDFGDMVKRQPFDIPAGAALVLPEIE